MHTSSPRYGGRRAAAMAALALLLVGTASTTATAESIREEQWFLNAMHAEDMWRTSTGEGVTVAVIDTGVDPDNPDLRGRVLSGKDLAPEGVPGDEHTDYDGHGTGMAGLIAGTGAYGGGKGAFGLAPGAKILPIRLPVTGTAANKAEGAQTFNSALVLAIRYATDQGVKVINISQAVSHGSPQVTTAVKYALDKGALVFAGVGNDGDTANQPMYPAATPGVIGVAAVGKDLRRTAWSQYGPQVDISAPGEDMLHACGGKTGLCETEGTSDATALASASAALIWSAHPDWTNNQVLRVMLNTIGAPTDGAKRNDSIGYGIVRPRIALTNPGDPGPADEYPLPDLAAADTPSASTGPTGANPPAPSKDIDPGMTVPAPDEDTDLSWLPIGIGAVTVAALAITATGIFRRRRRFIAPSPTPSSPDGPPHPHALTGFGPPPAMPPSSPPPNRGTDTV
ncbi:type VII secretion-associated serine protease mycosin [Streptomyces sp. bgisy153]|uniref:type VII secretion-associated serine protease mycosin n=1 Tax=Streptomyces sp. bgisy153 TaxID=3413793 RepID=UPI003D719EAA